MKFKYVIFRWILVIDSCEIALIWISLDFTHDQSTLVQVMAWCRQATSHYLSQCWPRSLSPFGVTRQEWVDYIKIGKKWEFRGFWPFSLKNFKWGTMKLGLLAYHGYFQVCMKNGPCGPNFGPQIGQYMYIGFCQFSGKVSTWFTRNFIHEFIGATFVGV